MNDPSLPARNRLVPHDEVVAYVRAVADKLGRTPSRTEWYLMEPHPRGLGRAGLADRYGSWSKAMAACGLEPRTRSAPGVTTSTMDTPGMHLRHARMKNRRMVSGGYRGSGGVSPRNDSEGPA